MAKDQNPLEDFNAKAKQAIEQTKEQVSGAVDTYFNFLRNTIASYPSGGTDLGEKLKSYAEKNVAAAHEYVKKLSEAKTFSDVVQIQSEFVRTQFELLQRQAREIGEISNKTIGDMMSAKVPFGPSS